MTEQDNKRNCRCEIVEDWHGLAGDFYSGRDVRDSKYLGASGRVYEGVGKPFGVHAVNATAGQGD